MDEQNDYGDLYSLTPRELERVADKILLSNGEQTHRTWQRTLDRIDRYHRRAQSDLTFALVLGADEVLENNKIGRRYSQW